MKLTELVSLNEETLKDKKTIYGIEVNEYVPDVIWHLEEIGLLLQYNEDNTYLHDDLLDVILDYKNAKTSVLLEVPFSPEHNLKTLNHACKVSHVDLSFLPPQGDEITDETWDIYKQQLVTATELWLENTNSKYVLFPCSGYFHYMIREYFDGKPKSISDDPYIVENFVDPIEMSIMDEIKDALRVVFIEHIGGEEEFEIYANSMAMTIGDKIVEMSDDIVKQMAENESADQQAKGSEKPEQETEVKD